MKKAICFICFFYFIINSYSQETAKILNDSAKAIYKKDPQKAILILEKALQKAKSENNLKETNISKNALGLVYRDLGKYEKAKALSQDALNHAKDSIVIAASNNNIGVCNRRLGLYEDALKSYLKALAIYEAKSYLKDQATINNNIGMVYSYLGMNDKAIDYHLKAKAVFENLDNKKGISEVYNNIAIIYANDGNLDKALDYFKYSLNIEESLNDKKGIAESANNVGAVFYYMSQIDSALVYFVKSVNIEKAIGNFSGVGASYNNIAQTLIENNRLNESKKYIDSAFYYAEQSKTTYDIETAFLNYTQYYEYKNDTKNALQYYKNYSKLHDSILNIDTNSKVAELEIQYQTEKKEKEILTQRADLAEQELDLSKKNYYILGLGALAVVLLLIGYLFYNQQRLKNRQLQKENELKDALVKIENQNRLQDQRLRISRDLHDNIGAQLTFIISSLDNLKYGFKLSENLSSKLKSISQFTSTTIYELRDTIWAMNKNEITFEDLQTRISNFIEKGESASDKTQFNFSVDDALSNEKIFTSVEGMNIYRIIQEAINNAIKYSEADKIDVEITSEDTKTLIKISDNGKGFDENTIEFGNGLNNMKKRAQEINSYLQINSKKDEGTTIILEVKAN